MGKFFIAVMFPKSMLIDFNEASNVLGRRDESELTFDDRARSSCNAPAAPDEIIFI
jgi:hypothetical protein